MNKDLDAMLQTYAKQGDQEKLSSAQFQTTVSISILDGVNQETIHQIEKLINPRCL